MVISRKVICPVCYIAMSDFRTKFLENLQILKEVKDFSNKKYCSITIFSIFLSTLKLGLLTTYFPKRLLKLAKLVSRVIPVSSNFKYTKLAQNILLNFFVISKSQILYINIYILWSGFDANTVFLRSPILQLCCIHPSSFDVEAPSSYFCL